MLSNMFSYTKIWNMAIFIAIIVKFEVVQKFLSVVAM